MSIKLKLLDDVQDDVPDGFDSGAQCNESIPVTLQPSSRSDHHQSPQLLNSLDRDMTNIVNILLITAS